MLFSPATTNSVFASLDVHAVDTTDGAIDQFDHIDAYAGHAPHLRAFRVPLGAPIAVGGWALDPNGRPFSSVALVVDEALSFAAKCGVSRRDVVMAKGPDTPEFTGFQGILPTEALVSGGHSIAAYGRTGDGAWYEVGRRPFWTFAMIRPELGTVSRPVRILVDAVDDLDKLGRLCGSGAPIPSGHIALIRGWAVDRRTHRAPAGICAIDGAAQRWSSPCDLIRGDLAHIATADPQLRVGFEITVPTDILGRGRHPVRITAFDDQGRPYAHALEIELDVAAPKSAFPGFADMDSEIPEAQVMIRRPEGDCIVLDAQSAITAKRGDIFELDGWAIAPDGSAATDIFVELHHPELGIPPNRHFPLAGFRRNKVPRQLHQPPRDDAWFWYRLGTADLSRRTYELTLAVVAAGRRSYARRRLGTLRVT
jgi:hypothetical protein